MANPVRIQAEVVSIDTFYEGIVGYTFKPLNRVPRFAPGQFLHLTIDPFDQTSQWPESRVFSIASSPLERDVIKILISRKGYYTGRIIDELKIGSYVWLKLPYGDFTFDTSCETIVLIGGGTGIAPFISFLAESEAEQRTNRVFTYYGVRRREHLVYEAYLSELEQKLPNVSVEIFIQDDGFHENSYRKGIIDIADIIAKTKTANPDYYLSGPWAMIDSFRKTLIENNIPVNKIKIDEWS